MWSKKGRSTPAQQEGGGGLFGGGLADALATVRRSGTMATTAGGQLHHKPHRDVHILQEQLESVQMQLQEKHNEINYFKSHCEELEREISRLRLALALKGEELEELKAQLEAGESSNAPRGSSHGPGDSPQPKATAAFLSESAGGSAKVSFNTSLPGRKDQSVPRSMKPTWVVGVGNRQSKRLSMLWKDTALIQPGECKDLSSSSLDLASSDATRRRVTRRNSGLAAQMDAQLDAVRDERERRNSKRAPKAAVPDGAVDHAATYRCDLESRRGKEGEGVPRERAQPPAPEPREGGQEGRAGADSAAGPEAAAAKTEGGAQDVGPVSEKEVQLDQGERCRGAEKKMIQFRIGGVPQARAAGVNLSASAGCVRNSKTLERSLTRRSMSLDSSADHLCEGEVEDGDDPGGAAGEPGRDPGQAVEDEVKRQKRLSWVKAGSPWREDDPSVAEAKWAKRKSLSALRLLKEENRRGGVSLKSWVPLVARCEGFSIENEYDYTTKTDTNLYSFVHQTWYKDHFYKQDHACFIGTDTPLGTVVAVVKKEKDPSSLEFDNQFRIMVITQDGDQKTVLPGSAIGAAAAATPGWAFRVIDSAFPLLQTTGSLKLVENPQLPQALYSMEEKERPRKYKFGVVLVRKGQDTEEDFFCNQRGSADWEMFLRLLGNRVQLQGWEKFAGGLDVRTGTTGTESIYTEWRDNQIMFHVSTLLPYTTGDRQQIERKRHIGNDIVLVIFLDDSMASYSPSLIKSHFIHVVIVVRVEKWGPYGDAHLRVSVTSKEGVPVFGPTLPKPALFPVSNPRHFRDFFLSKLINGELAAYRTASFSRKLRLARRALLDDISLKYWT